MKNIGAAANKAETRLQSQIQTRSYLGVQVFSLQARDPPRDLCILTKDPRKIQSGNTGLPEKLGSEGKKEDLTGNTGPR